MRDGRIRFSRRVRLCCVILCAVLLTGGCGSRGQEAEKAPGLQITFFDVGKGDCILVEAQEQAMLIDAGYEDTSGMLLNYLNQHEIGYLDYMVLTHFDKDHVGGADRVLENIEVGEILQPDYESESGQYLEYADTVREQELDPVPVAEIRDISIGGASCVIYPSQEKSYEEENDFSLVISMVYGERSFLFAGDCERVRLEELLNQTDLALAHDVLKVPHHGKKEKNSKEFLEAVSPSVAVITCSEEEPPSDKVLKSLRSLGASTYLTSGGNVVCTSDGKALDVVQE